jgi:hypothetical protein
MAVGNTLTMLRCATATTGCPDPQLLGQIDNATFGTAGTVQLGLLEPDDVPTDQPYLVTFGNVEIRTTSRKP